MEAGAGSVLLMGATALSLWLANNAATSGAWVSVWDQTIGPAIGGHQLSIRGWINEAVMAVFFFVVGMEIKRECLEGSLKSIKSALLPCIAALGGMIVPMMIYIALNISSPLGVMSGWAVPMATDIAFAMGVINFFKAKLPPAVPAFLLTLATVDDLGAIAVSK